MNVLQRAGMRLVSDRPQLDKYPRTGEAAMTGSRGKTSEEIYGMSAEDATTLFELRRIFEHNYRITFTDGIWTASRLGLWRTATVITADSAPKLRGLIGEDLRLWAAEARKHQ